MAKQPATKTEDVKTETTAVATQQSGALASISNQMPDWAKEYAGPAGTENIDADDVNIPRLKLGQSMTPEVKDKLVGDGDMFHSITKQVLIPLGKSAIVTPVCYQKEFVLWRDRSEGGGIFARAKRVVDLRGNVRYAWDKPNSVFTTKVKGTVKVEWKTGNFIDEDGLGEFGSMMPQDPESQPAATAHYNYIMYLHATGDMVAVSFNRSSAKKAKDLNAMLKMGTAPMFMRCFQIGAVPDQNDAGDKFYNYATVPAGFVQDKALFENLQKMYTEFHDKGVTVDWSDESSGSAEASNRDKEAF